MYVTREIMILPFFSSKSTLYCISLIIWFMMYVLEERKTLDICMYILCIWLLSNMLTLWKNINTLLDLTIERFLVTKSWSIIWKYLNLPVKDMGMDWFHSVLLVHEIVYKNTCAYKRAQVPVSFYSTFQ